MAEVTQAADKVSHGSTASGSAAAVGGTGDYPAATPKTSLEHGATCLSHTFLTWLDPLLDLGTKRVITVEDLGSLDAQDEAQMLYEKFDALWRAEVERNGLENARCVPLMV